MDISTQISEEVKNKTYTELTDIMLHALDSGAITAEDAEEASRFILDQLDTLPTQSHLDAFLEELTARWGIFQPMLLSQKENADEQSTQQSIQNIQQEIKQFNQ